MGTTCIPSITTRKDMIQNILDEYRYANEGYQLLDHSASGNELYLLIKHPKGYKFIGMYKLSGGGRENGWCYKAMDESMGPNYYNCPERILAQSEDESEYGTQWRDECRRLREAAKRRKAWRKTLRPGEVLEVHSRWRQDPETRRQVRVYDEVVFEWDHTDTFFVGHRVGETQRFRFRWGSVKMPETQAV